MTPESRAQSDASWLDDNNRYLAASLHWLRLRLQQLVPVPAPPPATIAVPAPATPSAPAARVIQASTPTPPPPASAPPSRGWFSSRQAPPAPPLLASPTVSVIATEDVPLLAAPTPAAEPIQLLSSVPPSTALADAAQARDTAAKTDPPPALLQLADRFGLALFERDTLLLCAAAELDPNIGPLFAAAQANAARSYPTFALALQTLDQPTWDALSDKRPLRRMRLTEIHAMTATPLTASPLRADERIVHYIKGLNALDERLSLLASPPSSAPPALAESQHAVAEEVLLRLQKDADGAAIVQLVGGDAASKFAVAQQVCSVGGRQLYRIALDALPTQRSDVETFARLWERDGALLPLALYVDADALDTATSEIAAAFSWFITREPGLLFIALREELAQSRNAGFAVAVEKPTFSEQSAAWREALDSATTNDEAKSTARLLAGQFDLNISDIHHAAARAIALDGSESLANRAWDQCRDLARPHLDALAQRLEPKATWDDLVLADESLQLLRQIGTQVRRRYQVYEEWGYAKRMTRGLGITALFAGESGTGKTMAAEVIANELRLNLYRIDLSAVVSKYIGETEKNLRRLFDAAEQGGAILFFDEADALFGKRSEVKDSHDRYANIEINYLLQRMESFRGLAILATNMKSALDLAFMRRLRFVVNFAFPSPVERQRMWRQAFPTEVPQEDLDLERLARFNLTGGNIHSIALNAAFNAAHRNCAVTQPLLLSALRTELRKLDKPINEAEFR